MTHEVDADVIQCTERFRHQSVAMKATAAKAERFEKLHAELTKKYILGEDMLNVMVCLLRYANMEPAEIAQLRENERKLKAELAQAQAHVKDKVGRRERRRRVLIGVHQERPMHVIVIGRMCWCWF